ncbi:hypothetical protein [Nitrospirillum pindoramense]|uniref:Uncharacterized protein n=1 Tax=Nitrospirillum amazonense TaxID=28077 RepID=A0A560HK88_9PROT|nr:hypothetical protein [Nitrospirillum amazonense]TWB45784.1 hypothetical protein FBZ90_101117 [Nitrospirillum amazonense]
MRTRQGTGGGLLASIDRVKVISAFIATVTALGGGFAFLTQLAPPQPWWRLAGFPRDPGFFVADNPGGYPVCLGWTDVTGASRLDQDGRTAGLHMTEIASLAPIRPGREGSLSALIPTTAKIAHVYCGISTPGGHPSECLRSGCAPAVVAGLADKRYTQGQVITLTLRNMAPDGRTLVKGHAWLVWRE